MDTFRINTSNTLPESYQQRVYKNTLAKVKHQIQQAENLTPAVVIRVEAVCVDNANLLDYLTSEVALEEPEIGSTNPNILIDNNCIDDELHFRIPGGSANCEDGGDESDERNVIPTASGQWLAATELERFHQKSSAIDGYEDEDGDKADVDHKEEASQADDGSTQNVEDWGHSRFNLGTSDVNGYEGEDGNDADAHEEEEASPADDASTQNGEEWGHSTRECKD